MKKSLFLILASSLAIGQTFMAFPASAEGECQKAIEAAEKKLAENENKFKTEFLTKQLDKVKSACKEQEACLKEVEECWASVQDAAKAAPKVEKCVAKELDKACKAQGASDECCEKLKKGGVKGTELERGVPRDAGKSCGPQEEANGNNAYYAAFHQCLDEEGLKAVKKADQCTDKAKSCQ